MPTEHMARELYKTMTKTLPPAKSITTGTDDIAMQQ